MADLLERWMNWNMKLEGFSIYLLRSLLLLLLIFMLAGCLSPITLNCALVVYDDAVTSAESE